MESSTASSNSMGPGIINAGCGFWFDIFFGITGSVFCTGGSGFFSCGFGRFIAFPRSSSNRELRSVEKGVFNSRNGLLSRCLAIWLMREPAEARDVGAMRGNSRLFTEVERSLCRWPRVHIRYSESCEGRELGRVRRNTCRGSCDGNGGQLRIY
jgi:hypothetical protein